MKCGIMRRQPTKRERPEPRAFTLIELILVLALLAVATSLAAPSLSRFFRGQTLRSEARQLLSLTHAGQSRAVADGFPILLWIDPTQRLLGLQEEGTTRNGNAQDTDPKAEEFAFGENVQIEAVDASPVTVNGQSLPAIRFLPDGTADENSPTTLRLTGQNGEMLWLIQTTNRLGYEIRNTDR
jgi:type II secretion system protein H